MNDWREGHASALDYEVAELEKVLAELDNAHAILETRGRDGLCTQIRSVHGWLRSEITSMTDEARDLRAAASDQDRPLPMYFSRRV